jgi:hypothetical protein
VLLASVSVENVLLHAGMHGDERRRRGRRCRPKAPRSGSASLASQKVANTRRPPANAAQVRPTSTMDWRSRAWAKRLVTCVTSIMITVVARPNRVDLPPFIANHTQRKVDGTQRRHDKDRGTGGRRGWPTKSIPASAETLPPARLRERRLTYFVRQSPLHPRPDYDGLAVRDGGREACPCHAHYP